MVRDFCDNTDCENSKETLYKTELRSEFGSNICYWCSDCIKRDKDMIENILNHDKTIDYSLNYQLDIR